MEIMVGDILIMKKKHPCGENRFFVERTGCDIKIRCLKCDRLIMSPRKKLEKHIKGLERDESNINLVR